MLVNVLLKGYQIVKGCITKERSTSSDVVSSGSFQGTHPVYVVEEFKLTKCLALDKHAEDNFYIYMDSMADMHLHQPTFQMHQHGRQRLTKLVHDKGLFDICLELCFPHVYIGWRDVILDTDLFDELCPSLAEGSGCITKTQKRLLLSCFMCRVKLEIGHFAQSEKWLEQARTEVTSLPDSWVTGVFYYTEVLLELQRSKRQCNREAVLTCVLESFQKSCKGFQQDSQRNFCIKYFHLAAQVLVLYVETDHLFHTTDLSCVTTFKEKAIGLRKKFQDCMDQVNMLITILEVYFQYDSSYWSQTLIGMRECINKQTRLLETVPVSEEHLKFLQKQAMAYISVLVKHPSHERRESIDKALFPGLTNTFQERDSVMNKSVKDAADTEKELSYNTMDDMSDIHDLAQSDGTKQDQSNSE